MSQSISTNPTTTPGLTGNSSAANSASNTAATNSALTSLTGNFQTFLQMLMTQLQNQDPTSPMDSNAFTTELVQFAGVEQQINTNTNLTNLIQLTQGSSVLQTTQMIGKTIQATSSQLSLQNSSAAVSYTAQTPGSVAISISSSTGQDIYDTQMSANTGNNTWTWNGQTNAGTTAADGVYNITVTEAAADGTTQQLTTTITGTVTGVQTTGTSVNIEIGHLSVPVASVTSVQ